MAGYNFSSPCSKCVEHAKPFRCENIRFFFSYVVFIFNHKSKYPWAVNVIYRTENGLFIFCLLSINSLWNCCLKLVWHSNGVHDSAKIWLHYTLYGIYLCKLSFRMRQLITADGLFGASVQMHLRDTVMIALNIQVRILTAQNKLPSISLSFPTPIFDAHGKWKSRAI